MRSVVCWAGLLCVCGVGCAWAATMPPAEVVADWRAQDGVAEENTSYIESSERWREMRLRKLLAEMPRIVFTKHYDLGGSHYAYTEGQSDAQQERHFKPGSSLCMLVMEGLYGRVETLLADPTGVIRDPDVSYDGQRILFAWKKSLDEDDYHLYEMNVADRVIRQLTFGLGYTDYEGAYLPNGDIVFNSTRCVQTVDCWWTEVSNLYTCDADGRFLRRLSYDQVHSNYPTVTPDGRVIYTRWDYSDRGQIYPQGLFQMRTDGTAQTAFYGNNSWFPTSILHARGIPNTNKVVAIFSGHHSPQKGWLGILDPAKGREENLGAQLIAPVRLTEAVHIDSYGQDGDQFQYPYPLDEHEFVVAFKPAGASAPFGIYWMHEDGRRELLVSDPTISCNQPVPLVVRSAPHTTASLVDYRKTTGTFYLQDVYHGPGLEGVPRGTVKNLRVVALEFRAAGVTQNTNSGPAGGALISTPISIEGTWDVKTVLGTATVYEDGSASFIVPAQTPVYFQALDSDNHAVQTMRSWAQLQPGESFACAGCHEDKNSAPPPGLKTQAQRAGPQELTPWYGPPRGFSFEKEIQPILDDHCIRCHFVTDPERMADPTGALGHNRPNLTAARPVEDVPMPDPLPKGVKPAFSLYGAPGTWSPAYRALANRRVTNWINIQESPVMLPPYHAGAAKSPLVAMLQKGHNDVQLSQEEMDRITCWIDLLVPCFGDYTEGLDGDHLAFYNKFVAKREAWEEQEALNIVDLIEEGRTSQGASEKEE